MACGGLISRIALLTLLLPVPALAQQGAQPGPADAGNPGKQGVGEVGPKPKEYPPGGVVQQTNVPGNQQQLTATATMHDRSGKDVGTVAFVETGSGVLIQARLTGIPEGGHGFHIHENGSCEPPDFKSAGGHYNPGNAGHGFLGRAGMHAGDLPNVFAGKDGNVRVDFLSTALKLEPGPGTLMPSESKAVVLHATVDDYATDPAGASGDRIACGVIAMPMTTPAAAGNKP